MTDALIIRKLEIKQAAGFPHAGLPPMEYCAGLNIVFGPNASGKTTTARAIQALLWPQPDATGTYLLAEIALGDRLLQSQYLSGSRDLDLPFIGDPSYRFRYMLAQHELLTAGDDKTGFAELILKEAHGGLDIGKAIQQLGYKEPGRGRVSAEYRDAHQAYETAKSAERKTLHLESQLPGLTQAIEEAIAARQRVGQLSLALEYLAQLHEAERLVETVAKYPPELAALTGQELNGLDDYNSDIEKAQKNYDDATQERQDAQQRLQQTGLTDIRAAEDAEAITDALCNAIESLEKIIEPRQMEYRRTASEALSAYHNLGGGDDAVAAGPLDTSVVNALNRFVEQGTGRLAARQEAIDAQLRWIDSLSSPLQEPQQADILLDALKCLYEWLAIPKETRKPWLPVTAALLCLLAAGVGVLAFFIDKSVFGGLAFLFSAAAGILWLYTRKQRQPGVTREELTQRYAAFQLNGPANWAAEDVEKFIRELHHRIAASELAKNVAIKRNELQKQIEDLLAQAQALEPEKIYVAGLLGVAPARVADNGASLLYFVSQLIDWQHKRAQAKGMQEELDGLRSDLAERLAQANMALAPFQYPSAGSSGELRSLLKRLSDKKSAFFAAEKDIHNAQWRQAEHGKQKDRLLEQRDKLLVRLHLDADPEIARGQLVQYLAQREEYRETVRERDAAIAIREETDRKGQQWPDQWTALKAMGELLLREQLHESQELVDTLLENSRKKGDYERQVTSAKEQAACEHAQMALEQITSKLRERLEETLRAGIGWQLATRLEAQVLDASLPDVYLRARKLFADFTGGRYELRLAQAEKDFRAYDRTDDKERDLDQLSSATRVQLLMAVRIAFVEKGEQGIKLPLLMDEALACSDDQRERAIIEATLQICREGRQVFYFTSKPDEAARWQERARDAGVEVRAVPLEQTPPEKVITHPSVSRPTIPDPAGKSHNEYGAAIGVARVDFLSGSAGKAHVWYVVDDNDRLRSLLEADISTCGQLLSSHLTEVVASLLGAEQAIKARELAMLLAKLERLWWEGRGKPLNLQALQEAGILTTDTFRREITYLAELLHWDAGKLMLAFKNKEIKGFRSESIRKFQEYCEDPKRAYLVDGEPLAMDELRERLLGASVDAINKQIITPAEVLQLFDRVFTAPPASEETSDRQSLQPVPV